MSIDNTGEQQQEQQSDATNNNNNDINNNTHSISQNTQNYNGIESSAVENDLIHRNNQRLTHEEIEMPDDKNTPENGSTTSDKENDSAFVIHNKLYPTACSNTVTLTSISTKKPNVTSIEMRSSGTVPKKADIENYFSSATLLVKK